MKSSHIIILGFLRFRQCSNSFAYGICTTARWQLLNSRLRILRVVRRTSCKALSGHTEGIPLVCAAPSAVCVLWLRFRAAPVGAQVQRSHSKW